MLLHSGISGVPYYVVTAPQIVTKDKCGRLHYAKLQFNSIVGIFVYGGKVQFEYVTYPLIQFVLLTRGKQSWNL